MNGMLNYEHDACDIICYKFVKGEWNDIAQLISSCSDYSNKQDLNLISVKEFSKSNEYQAKFSFANVVVLSLDSYSISRWTI